MGGGLWLFGSRFSRSLLTLVAVAVGAWLGKNVTAWLALPLQGWAGAMVGALVFGIGAYALHGLVVALALGMNLAMWAAVTVFVLYSAGFTLPAYGPETTIGEYLKTVWTGLPDQIHNIGPFVCGAALLIGLAVTMMWSRLATFLLYSLLGVTMLVGLGLVAVELSRPQLLTSIPDKRSTQLAILGGMVLFGFLVQWRMSRPHTSESSKEETASE